MANPTIVCDSSSLISLSETCNLGSLEFLKKECNARFLVPPEVKNEVFVRPVRIPKYEFSALRLNNQLEHGVLEESRPTGIEALTRQVLELSNSAFSFRGRKLQLVQRGEAECVALCIALKADGVLVDEKTMRLFIESPSTLLQRMGGEYEGGINIDKGTLATLGKLTQGIFCLRSSELLGIAAAKGFFRQFGAHERQAYVASLTALRNSGCGITTDEIAELAAAKN